jgi:hypothetical protein
VFGGDYDGDDRLQRNIKGGDSFHCSDNLLDVKHLSKTSSSSTAPGSRRLSDNKKSRKRHDSSPSYSSSPTKSRHGGDGETERRTDGKNHWGIDGDKDKGRSSHRR